MGRSWALVGGHWWHALGALPYSTLVGVLLYLDLRAGKEQLTLETLQADLQASAT